MHKRPVFVTGGTGLLGSHLILNLVSAGERAKATYINGISSELVKRIFSYYSDTPDEIYAAVEWVECDICDYDCLADAMSGCGWVYHCAAVVSYEEGHSDFLIKNNVQGTANIVRACLQHGIEKLCHVSSTAALSACNDSIVNETQEWNDAEYHTPYAISKHLSEEEVWKGISQGLSAVIVNPSVILGPGDWTRGSPSFFSNIAAGMLFYPKGVTGYVDVNDVVKAMIALMKSGVSGERFIITSENLSYRGIFALMAKSLGVRRPFIYMPRAISYPAMTVWRFLAKLTGKQSPITPETLKAAYSIVRYDNSKITNALGITFAPMEESVAAIAALYSAEHQRYR